MDDPLNKPEIVSNQWGPPLSAGSFLFLIMSNDDAGQGLGCFAVFDDEGSADEDVVDAGGVLVRRDEGVSGLTWAYPAIKSCILPFAEHVKPRNP